jgi:hypothetical protein
LDFKIDIERDRIWHPREAERELRERGYGNAWRGWLEGDHLVYLIHPEVSPQAQLGWQRFTGTLLLVMGGGAFCFKRTIVVREPGGGSPKTIEAQLVAFPTSVQMVAMEDEAARGG